MRLFSLFKDSGTFYFPGCVSFKFPEYVELYKRIFYKLGIDFDVLDLGVCCGLPVLEQGYEGEARKLMRKNFENFKIKGVKRIITNCPACYKVFSQDYPEMIPDWDIEVVNLWGLILEKLENKPRLIKQKAMEFVSYHDSCYLGRYSGIYDEPRKILKLLGYELEEMNDSRENSFCCGSCGGLPRTNFALADKIAKERILQAKRVGVKKIIVASLDNYKLLKKNSDGIDIVELSEVLGLGLGIKKMEIPKEDERFVEDEVIDIEVENE